MAPKITSIMKFKSDNGIGINITHSRFEHDSTKLSALTSIISDFYKIHMKHSKLDLLSTNSLETKLKVINRESKVGEIIIQKKDTRIDHSSYDKNADYVQAEPRMITTYWITLKPYETKNRFGINLNHKNPKVRDSLINYIIGKEKLPRVA